MKIPNIRWALAVLVAICLGIGLLKGPVVLGVSAESSNGQYLFTGGTQPWALALAVLAICSYLALMYAEPSESRKPLRGVFRRFVAFGLDFFFVMITVTPITGLMAAVIEWRRTGIFEWSFERYAPAAGDWLVAAAGFALAVATPVFYFAWPLVRQRPSPGACIVGYQVVPDNGASLKLGRAVWRTLVGFVALCAWWLAPFVGRDKMKGKFWLDKVFATRAVLL